MYSFWVVITQIFVAPQNHFFCFEVIWWSIFELAKRLSSFCSDIINQRFFQQISRNGFIIANKSPIFEFTNAWRITEVMAMTTCTYKSCLHTELSLNNTFFCFIILPTLILQHKYASSQSRQHKYLREKCKTAMPNHNMRQCVKVQ